MRQLLLAIASGIYHFLFNHLAHLAVPDPDDITRRIP